jgi:hypothetical protein
LAVTEPVDSKSFEYIKESGTAAAGLKRVEPNDQDTGYGITPSMHAQKIDTTAILSTT